MPPRVIHAAYLLLVVPLLVGAAPAGAEGRPPVLEPVRVSGARTTGACAESKQEGYQRHHLCTNKNDKSESNGGPWTPDFETLFARAGMSLEDPANIVYLRDHKGPHPKEYHSEIFERLSDALRGCRPQADCRAKLVDELDRIAGDVCTPGSTLNKLATRKP